MTFLLHDTASVNRVNVYVLSLCSCFIGFIVLGWVHQETIAPPAQANSCINTAVGTLIVVVYHFGFIMAHVSNLLKFK
ncbi:MAG: hypothetical protein Q4B82_08750 [Alysiella sp.]|uniref:hypothetical protein n=1 Tax=Alysiella sp. TaxID=1872483 RepID=UPI0026DC04B0|nr:hypothetical protein [Alysiella sp.]MDO4434649.1 hypothetical protein [Alysiella sp.]